MPFPEIPERVIYDNNPLDQVICQVKFPDLLRIVADIPAEFQEAIVDEFPIFEELNTPPEISQDTAQQLPQGAELFVPLSGRKAFNFSTADKKWTISLTSGFLALTTSDYRRWEEFFGYFEDAFAALLAIYKPKQFTRVGLRYQNVIRRSRIGLEESPWSNLLRNEIVGLLAAPELTESLFANSAAIDDIQLRSCKGKVRIRRGFATDNETKEHCYYIDSDFFCSDIEGGEDARNQATCFNGMAQRLFRWCITQTLHDAMGPRRL